jgi:hypothetical protein
MSKNALDGELNSSTACAMPSTKVEGLGIFGDCFQFKAMEAFVAAAAIRFLFFWGQDARGRAKDRVVGWLACFSVSLSP